MIDGGRDEWINNGMTDRNGPWTESTKARRDVGAASTKPRRDVGARPMSSNPDDLSSISSITVFSVPVCSFDVLKPGRLELDQLDNFIVFLNVFASNDFKQ